MFVVSKTMDLSRQTSFLSQFGKLSEQDFSKRIVIIGCGGCGSPLGELLARGGFINITLIDFDVIEQSNIQRQLFLPKHIGSFKAEKLKKRMLTINPEMIVTVIVDQLQNKNISEYLKNCEFIFDATDNFSTRFMIDSYAKEHNIPWMYLGAIKSEVICSLMNGKHSQFETLISKDAKDENCSVGVLASTTFIGASMSYTEFLKYLLLKEKYDFKLLKFNIWNNKYFEVKL